jgi:hypothetical protein
VIIIVNPLPRIANVNPQTQAQTTNDLQMTAAINLTGTFTEIAWTNDNPTITSLAASGRLPDLGQPELEGMTQLPSFTMNSTGIVNITFTPYYSNSIAGGPRCRGTPVTATVTRGIPPQPYLVIQSLNSTNVVLEWIAYANTALLSATNLISPNWSGVTNSVTTNGPTNQVTIPLLGVPPNQFFRLTNAPVGP